MKKMFKWLITGIFLLASCTDKQMRNEQDAENLNSAAAAISTKGSGGHGLNTLTAKEKSKGWQLLFDGKTTEGWHNYLRKGVEGWQVKDGILFSEGSNGDIVTDDQYTQFELSLEWKIKAKGNSGIFYYVIESDEYEYMHQTGPEFQIIDDKNYPQNLLDKQKTGALSDVLAPKIFASRAPGEWNSTTILVKRRYVEHWLNGKRILEYKPGSANWKELVSKSKFSLSDYAHISKGHIGLQDHGNYVAFRNIKIREL